MFGQLSLYFLSCVEGGGFGDGFGGMGCGGCCSSVGGVEGCCRGGSSDCGRNALLITCSAGCPCLSFASSCCL